MSDQDRIDFSSFEALSHDAFVSDIAARCAPRLDRRRRQRASIQLVAWWRPALAAALLIGLVSSAILGRPRRTRVDGPTAAIATSMPAREIAQMLDVPAALVRHVTQPTAPTILELVPEVTP